MEFNAERTPNLLTAAQLRFDILYLRIILIKIMISVNELARTGVPTMTETLGEILILRWTLAGGRVWRCVS